MKRLVVILCALVCLSVFADEVIPPKPAQYFNDYAGVVSGGTVAQLNQKLEQFERDSSCQILVAVYPKMQSDSSVEDYTVRVAQAWRAGEKGKDNGAVLFVFIQDRKMFIQVGYGLEGAMPDAICKRIVENEIKPYFKAGNYDAGLTAGVNAMLAAAKGEYKGTGHTVNDQKTGSPAIITIIFVVIVIVILISRIRQGIFYSSGGYYTRRGWSSGGGGWGGGGGGGGGFSSGGGNFGGGGAGGRW